MISSVPKTAFKFFDINLRQDYYDKFLVAKLLELADILKLNIGELKILKNILKLSGSIDDMCMQIKAQYQLKYLILNDTAKESRIFGETLTFVKNDGIQQSFAYGAGNAFAGAFMTSILKGKSQQEAHEIANQAAVEVCLASCKNS